MIAYILLGFVFLSFWFLWYMGFYKRIVIERKRLGRRYVLYREYSTNYKDVRRIFKEITSELKGVFERYIPFGVYYDNPQILADPSKCRASVGIYVNENDINKAQGFATIHKHWHFKEVPEMDAIYTTFPHRNSLSIFWAVMRIFPKLVGYLGQHRLVENYEKEIDGIVENYYWGGPNKYTEYLIPYGKRIKEHTLTTLPHPPLKPEYQKKSD